MRLIDSDMLWMSIYQKSQCPECPRNRGNNTVLGLIDEAPTIEAKPVIHGHWILKQEGKLFKKEFYSCSNCGSRSPILYEFNYCFNCGAKMDR